jgi:Transposase DDE domain group 1
MKIKLIEDTKSKYISQGGIYLIQEIYKQNHLDSFIKKCFPERGAQSLYHDSDLIMAMSYNIFAGGTYFEDVNLLREQLHVPDHISLPSTDCIRYRIEQLAEDSYEIINKKKVNHEFNINKNLSRVLAKVTVRLNPDYKEYAQTLDYDNTIIPTVKGDSRLTYKQGYGYQPGVMFIGREPVYLEGRNGNSPSTYQMSETLERGISILKDEGVKIGAIRIDGAGYQKEVFNLMNKQGIKYYIRGKHAISTWDTTFDKNLVKKILIGGREAEYFDMEWYTPGEVSEETRCRVVLYRFEDDDSQLDLFEGKYRYYVIYTNDWTQSGEEIINFYNQRGRAEQNFDRMKNDFNWAHPPFDNLSMNTVYWIFMAICCQLYHFLLKTISKVFKKLDAETRIKRFIFIFVNVVAKWTHQGRRFILNLYTDKPYDRLIHST